MNLNNTITFLLETGCEEIPSPMIPSALEQMKEMFSEKLGQSRLSFESIECFGTPRRLSILVRGLMSIQPDLDELLVGPPAAAAFRDGEPTSAGKGFAAGKGITPDKLEIVRTEKGEYAAARIRTEGKPAETILARIIPEILGSLVFPKTMRWGDGRHRFVRPVRNIAAIAGDRVPDFSFAGVKASRTSFGHRLFGEKSFVIQDPVNYKDILRKQFVLVDRNERTKRIETLLRDKAVEIGGKPVRDDSLLELVSNLMEYPNVIRGEFSEKYLGLPKEVLVTCMREHQKYFAVESGTGELMPYFLAVADVKDESVPDVTRGHEWVLRSRLADAEFFWNEDRKRSLDERAGLLENAVYQKDLGSYADKVKRIMLLSEGICRLCGREELIQNAVHAARLSKSDLTTDMVKEFPALQGIMGGIYAREEKLPEQVWKAVYSQYLPKSMDDIVPDTDAGAFVALSDKLDTLAGCFGLNIIPSGSKDPFALRRAGQGICKIILERKYKLPLTALLNIALEAYSGKVGFRLSGEEIQKAYTTFMGERLRHLLTSEGHSYDCINAVFATSYDDMNDAAARVRALGTIKSEKDIEALSVSFKRIKNLIGKGVSSPVDKELFTEEAETALFDSFNAVRSRADSYLSEGGYQDALKILAGLRGSVDRFFDEVMVMTEDLKIRDNRIALLAMIADMFLRIADISEIAVKVE